MGVDDRRRFNRKRKQSVISFHVIEDGGGDQPQQGVVMDCSQGGVRFTAKQSLRKNTRIFMKLDSEEWGEELIIFNKTPSLDLVELIGSVMWCLESENQPGEYEVGTRFIGQSEH